MLYWINTIVGVGLIAAPFALNFTDNTNATVSSIVLGLIVALASAYKALTRDTQLWEDWADAVAGVAAVLLPIIFGFGTATLAFWSIVALGVIAAALASYQLYESRLQPQ